MARGQPPTGPCKLCRKIAVIQRSHIISRWGYRRIVNTPTGAHNPVRVENDVAILSGEQDTEYMLCLDCEALIARREEYVSSITVNAAGTFPALVQTPVLEAATPEWRLGDARAHDCDAIEHERRT